MNDILMHYGVKHRSGRYPWGSGDNPYQRYGDFYSRYNRLKADGLTEKQIAEQLGVFDKFGNPSVKMLRARYSNAKNEKRAYDVSVAKKYKEDGLNNSEIGRKMGINESTVRSLLDESKAQRTTLTQDTAETLRAYVDDKKYIDIGPGLEHTLGVTRSRLDNAVALLEEDGYKRQFIQIDQMGTDHKTTLTVLTPPDVNYSDLSEHRYDIFFPGQANIHLNANGDVSGLGLRKPELVDPNRIKIVYNEEGGLERDGFMLLRRGAEDLTLGGKSYAQVRIGVEGNRYLKGMAAYGDDLPPGVDIMFFTNKHLGTDKMDVDRAVTALCRLLLLLRQQHLYALQKNFFAGTDGQFIFFLQHNNPPCPGSTYWILLSWSFWYFCFSKKSSTVSVLSISFHRSSVGFFILLTPFICAKIEL